MSEYNYNSAAEAWKANVAAGKINAAPRVPRGETMNQKRERARKELMDNFAKATLNWPKSKNIPNTPNTPNSLSTVNGSNSPRSIASTVFSEATFNNKKPVKKWAPVKTGKLIRSRKNRKSRKDRKSRR